MNRKQRRSLKFMKPSKRKQFIKSNIELAESKKEEIREEAERIKEKMNNNEI